MEFKKQIDKHMGRGKKEREGNKPQDTLNNREQTEGWWREVGGGWMVGIKKGICCCVQAMNHNSTHEINITLYVN